jgi:hypothetical protein
VLSFYVVTLPPVMIIVGNSQVAVTTAAAAHKRIAIGIIASLASRGDSINNLQYWYFITPSILSPIVSTGEPSISSGVFKNLTINASDAS